LAPTAGGAEARTSDAGTPVSRTSDAESIDARAPDARAPLDEGTQGSPDVDHSNGWEPRGPSGPLEPGENSDGTHPGQAPLSNDFGFAKEPEAVLPDSGELTAMLPQLSKVEKLRLIPPCHSSEAGATDSEGPCTLAPNTRPPGMQGSPNAGLLIDEGTPSEGTHREDTYLATLGIATATDTVAPPPTDHQTEHPDVPVEVSLTHFSIPWTSFGVQLNIAFPVALFLGCN
jgi:hypothetical protein